MKTKKITIMLSLSILFTLSLSLMQNRYVYTKEIEIKRFNNLKNSSFSVQIMGHGIGSINGVRMGSHALLKTLLKEARRNVYDYIKSLFNQNRTGTVNISNGSYISFTPCTKCPWPSVAEN